MPIIQSDRHKTHMYISTGTHDLPVSSNQMDTKHMCKSQQGHIIYAYHPIRWPLNRCVNHNRDTHTYHPIRWTLMHITTGTHTHTIQTDGHKTHMHITTGTHMHTIQSDGHKTNMHITTGTRMPTISQRLGSAVRHSPLLRVVLDQVVLGRTQVDLTVLPEVKRNKSQDCNRRIRKMHVTPDHPVSLTMQENRPAFPSSSSAFQDRPRTSDSDSLLTKLYNKERVQKAVSVQT